MKLEELSMLLKDTAEMIDSFVKTADTKSGEECCNGEEIGEQSGIRPCEISMGK